MVTLMYKHYKLNILLNIKSKGLIMEAEWLMPLTYLHLML